MSIKINEVIKNMSEDNSLNEIAKKYDLLNLYTGKVDSQNVTVVILLMVLYTVLVIVF